MHDPLAVGSVRATIAPVVHVDVDTTSGPGRGQTVCDMRGLYMDYPEQPGARCRLVLSLEDDFAPHLMEALLGYFESTTPALARAGSFT
jgi:purine nucleosidase